MAIKELSSVIQIDGADYSVHAKTAETADKLANKLTISVKQGDAAATKLIDFDGSSTKTATITIPVDNNQKIKTGSVTFGVNDVVEFVAGDNVAIAGDATNKKITISATGADSSSTSEVASKIKVAMDSGTANAAITVKSSDPEGGSPGDIWFKV